MKLTVGHRFVPALSTIQPKSTPDLFTLHLEPGTLWTFVVLTHQYFLNKLDCRMSGGNCVFLPKYYKFPYIIILILDTDWLL